MNQFFVHCMWEAQRLKFSCARFVLTLMHHFHAVDPEYTHSLFGRIQYSHMTITSLGHFHSLMYCPSTFAVQKQRRSGTSWQLCYSPCTPQKQGRLSGSTGQHCRLVHPRSLPDLGAVWQLSEPTLNPTHVLPKQTLRLEALVRSLCMLFNDVGLHTSPK